MQQDPYESHSYDSPALPYIPYAAPTVNTSQPYNAQVQPSTHNMYPPPPMPSTYESIPSYPQTLATTPQPGTDTSEQPVPGKKKRRRWLSIGAFILIALVVAASTFALASYLNRSTPMKTLNTFCTALQAGKYQTAYDQFSPTMQMNFTESQFAALFASDSIARCSHGSASENGTSTTTDLHLLHKTSKGINNDKIVVIKDSHDQWKINDIQKAS